MSEALAAGLSAVVAFLLGSIPFGVLVARRQGVDLTKVGSGNIGATNAVRVLGTAWGLAVFGLDVLKGLLPTLLARWLLPQGIGPLDPQPAALLLGAFAILGHSFSPWLGFRGGKGISTILGVGLGAIPLCALLSFGVMIALTAIARYISLASMVGVLSSLAWNRVLGDSPQLLPVLALLALFIVWRHRANIGRLLNGTESKFSFTRRGSGGPPSPRNAGGDAGVAPEGPERPAQNADEGTGGSASPRNAGGDAGVAPEGPERPAQNADEGTGGSASTRSEGRLSKRI